MKEQIESLFRNLESSNLEKQKEPALAITFLLERALWPGRYDSTYRLVLSEELLDAQLDEPAAVETALARTCDALALPTVSIGAKISLSTILGRTGRAGCVRATLGLLERESEALADVKICDSNS